MVLVNYADRKVNCKIVYCGTGESGKTTNLKYIYKQLDSKIRGEMTSLEGLNERTLFFDFLSIDLGELRGFNTSFSLYTAPGQKEYNAARKLILNGVDGIIFVADSRIEKRDENIESYNNLIENLKDYNLSVDNIPIVFQYNKRDMDNVLNLESLEKDLNKEGFPSFESIAKNGSGVFATLKAISNLILASLQ
ncbi:MAG: GTPase domain-containing protein [Candidatus Gastranaerophilales bacterium]|nr:GTPase domain-containing protein [Candidatus Gastranaerophilales bacterium]